jgi:hypothetical protein
MSDRWRVPVSFVPEDDEKTLAAVEEYERTQLFDACRALLHYAQNAETGTGEGASAARSAQRRVRGLVRRE